MCCICFGYSTFLFGQKDVLIYANESYWSAFVFDTNNNRYCYSNAKDVFIGCPIYSRGNIIKIGDTLFIKSDYDNLNLPLEVKSENKFNVEYNEFIINIIRYDNDPFNDAAYKFARESLFLIVNDADTIKLNSDTIKYYKNVKSFHIASIEKVRIPDTEVFYKITDNYNEFINYKTDTYHNIYNDNNFKVAFCLNTNYYFYKSINDTIVFKNSKAQWHINNKKAYINLKKTTLTKVKRIIGDCECWDKNNILNLKVDTPNCHLKSVKTP